MFTLDNTQGFTANEIKILNAVLERIMRENDEVDEQTISDSINNAWYAGITEEKLYQAAKF